MKTTTKLSKPKPKKRVSGYWVFRAPKNGKAPVTYYVKGYTRKPAKKVSKKRRETLNRARHIEAVVKNPLRPGWKRYESTEPDERVAYTYKVEVLVKSDYKYHMQFSPRDPMSLDKNERISSDAYVLQYWHSKFEPSIKAATVDFLEKVPEIRAYGDVEFISIELYRVSGVGPLREKSWILLRSFDEPNDVR